MKGSTARIGAGRVEESGGTASEVVLGISPCRTQRDGWPQAIADAIIGVAMGARPIREGGCEPIVGVRRSRGETG
jgi:hypothetical protein